VTRRTTVFEALARASASHHSRGGGRPPGTRKRRDHNSQSIKAGWRAARTHVMCSSTQDRSGNEAEKLLAYRRNHGDLVDVT